jgi:hypothetical protein
MKRILIFSLLLLLQENLSAQLPDLIPYRKGNLWGFCDSTKKMIIEPKYSFVFSFKGNTTIASKPSGKPCILDKQGNEIDLNDSIWLVNAAVENDLRIYSDLDFHDGVINEKGEIVMRPVNYDLEWMSSNYLFGKDDKFRPAALFNLQGKKLLDLTNYNDVEYDEDLVGRYACRNKNKKWGVIDTNGVTLIPFRFRKLEHIGDDGIVLLTRDSVFCYDKNCKPYKFSKRERGKYIDYELPESETVTASTINVSEYVDYHRFRSSGKYGLKDNHGNIVIEAKYNDLDDFFINGLTQVFTTRRIKSKKWDIVGYVDIHGTEYWEN